MEQLPGVLADCGFIREVPDALASAASLAMKNTPRINRAKLVAMGRDKVQRACDVHIREMRRFRHTDPRHRIHQGLLAQCFLAFKELSR